MKFNRKPIAWAADGALTASVLLGSLTGCGGSASTSAAASSGAYSAGTYTSSADGFGGQITVTMSFDESSITDVTVDGPDETEGIGSNAVEQLPEKILEAQSADIDSISGCTVSSTAILAAAKDCIAQASGTASSGFTAGTYTETVNGRNAAITVEVVLTDEEIQQVTVTSHSETESVASVALERIPAAIVENQTTKVDNVTGATVTSNAIKQAVNNAITEAGGSTASLPEEYAKPGEEIEDTADIIVVGGGGAGMAAATAALQGEDPAFGKTSFAFKVEKGPFFATPRKPALHHTMGGLTIDTDAHVLDTEGNVITGLYAAGEVTGGIHGGNRLGGNAVADCLTFGRIAGSNAAAA